MFLGERRELVEKLIVAEDRAGVDAALAALLPRQRQDFTASLEAMDRLAGAITRRGAAAAPPRGLPRGPGGGGRPAGGHQAARPAAARVPPRPHRAERRGRP